MYYVCPDVTVHRMLKRILVQRKRRRGGQHDEQESESAGGGADGHGWGHDWWIGGWAVLAGGWADGSAGRWGHIN